MRILRCHHHCYCVAGRKRDQCQHHRCHEKGLRGSVALSNGENLEPEEANANRGNPNNRAREKENDQKEVKDVVDREDLGGFDKDPVEWVENIGIAENVTAMTFAHRILDLVNGGEEHRDPDE